ncbi:MAG: tetratricopeptide repeat protein [Rhodocyclaceae bacterium]
MATPDNLEEQAHDAWDSNQAARAFQLFSQAANAGQENSMLNLGYFYDEGLGTRQDKDKAMYWYKRAYRKGSAAAASNIAILYRERSNLRLMFQWFKKSAELGDGDSAVELAKLYLEGTGVRRSKADAVRWLAAATSALFISEAGREEALMLLLEAQDGR